MSALVNSLRSRPGTLSLGGDAADAFTLRVQSMEGWDAIAVRCAPDASVASLKALAFEAFGMHHHPVEDYVLKLAGHEVRDEGAPLKVAGAREGSTFLLAYRGRRPVR